MAGSSTSRPDFESTRTEASPRIVLSCGDPYESSGQGADQRTSPDAVSNASNPFSPPPPHTITIAPITSGEHQKPHIGTLLSATSLSSFFQTIAPVIGFSRRNAPVLPVA